ncbi:hypothetical protein D3C72_1410820 [compost metagenome]
MLDGLWYGVGPYPQRNVCGRPGFRAPGRPISLAAIADAAGRPAGRLFCGLAGSDCPARARGARRRDPGRGMPLEQHRAGRRRRVGADFRLRNRIRRAADIHRGNLRRSQRAAGGMVSGKGRPAGGGARFIRRAGACVRRLRLDAGPRRLGSRRRRYRGHDHRIAQADAGVGRAPVAGAGLARARRVRPQGKRPR